MLLYKYAVMSSGGKWLTFHIRGCAEIFAMVHQTEVLDLCDMDVA